MKKICLLILLTINVFANAKQILDEATVLDSRSEPVHFIGAWDEQNFDETTVMDTKGQPVHFIGPWYGLFFASIYVVLNHILWSEQKNQIPVVYWDNRSAYFNAGGFNGKTNVWEYYFEPVSHINPRPSSRVQMVHSPLGLIGPGFSHNDFDQKKRHRTHDMINKYIKIRPVVQKKIDEFYYKNIEGKHTIGIHLRGTDKGREEKLVSPEKIVAVALKYARDDTQFLLASDEQRLMNRMIQLLKGRKVLFYDCYRSPNSKPLYSPKRPRPSQGQIGEDVLVEVSLLARTNFLVHTRSNVSSFALHFSPELEHVTVRQPGSLPTYPPSLDHLEYIVTHLTKHRHLLEYYF